jgi:dipeptidyl aminopeptidase/acylaminoacyl peptidase
MTRARLAASCIVTLASLAPASVAGSPQESSEEVPLIPRTVFFGNPERANVQISPDGTHLAYLAPHQNVLNVWTERTDGTGSRAVTTSTTRPIRSYFWAHNNEQIIYRQDRGGDENFRLYAVDLATGQERDLTPYEGVQARVIGTDRAFPDEILVALNRRVPQLHDVWRINTRTGTAEMIFQNDEGFASMIADRKFRVRVASRFDAHGGSRTFMRDSDDAASEWYELASWPMEDSVTSGPVSFSGDGKHVFMLDSRRTDTSALFRFTPPGEDRDGAYKQVAMHQRADIADIVFEPLTGKPQAVAFEITRREWSVLDPFVLADWVYLKQVADGELEIVSRDHDDDTWIVSYVRDDGPVEYYVYERHEKKAELLFTSRPALMGLPLAKMRAVEIPARDGLRLVSYLTTPASRAARDLPTVLLVHGGPWSRDSWGYNSIHQWLANRGYAVLSVNFRGSTGFGKAFLNAGNYEWAGRMTT